MNCVNCGKQYANNLNFCPFCGAANPSPGLQPKKKGKDLGEFWRELPMVGKSLFILGLLAIIAVVIAAVITSAKDSNTRSTEVKETETSQVTESPKKRNRFLPRRLHL